MWRGGWGLGDGGGESNFGKVVGFGSGAAGGECAPPAAAEARLQSLDSPNPPDCLVRVRAPDPPAPSAPRSPFAEQQFRSLEVSAAEPERVWF